MRALPARAWRASPGYAAAAGTRGRLTQLGHDFAAMRDQYLLAAAHHPQMLAEAVLQLPNADRDHAPIVVSCGYNR